MKSQVGDVITIPNKKGLYLVIKTEMTGGGHAMFNDYYPDAWHVTVQKLNGTTYVPKAKKFTFVQEGKYSFTTNIDGCRKVGTMEQKWVNFKK